jgi:hypothetical protein
LALDFSSQPALPGTTKEITMSPVSYTERLIRATRLYDQDEISKEELLEFVHHTTVYELRLEAEIKELTSDNL